MKALVTGATGFLGGHFCDRLRAQGHDVRATARRDGPAAARLRALGVDVVLATLADAASLRRACEGVEVVFHAAASVSYTAPAAKLEAANVAGTRHVLAAARAAGARRLVNVSTESVTLADADRVGTDESTPLPERWLDDYSRTKAQAEREVQAANGDGIETVSIRPPWVWGERDTSVLKAVAAMIRGGMFAFLGDGENRITPGHAQNVAAGAIAAAVSHAAPGRVYFVADDDRPTVREFLGKMCDACGIRLPERRVPYRLAYAAAAACDALRRLGVPRLPPIARPFVIHMGRAWVLSDARARAELGYRPVVTADQGFARLAAWVRESGTLDAAIRAAK